MILVIQLKQYDFPWVFKSGDASFTQALPRGGIDLIAKSKSIG